MKSIVKLFGVTSCCLLGGVTAANAEPVPLADDELDSVTAGVIESAFPPLFGLLPDDVVHCAAIGCRPGEPGYEPRPLFPPLPTSLPQLPLELPELPFFFQPLLGPFGGGGGCVGGPAVDCPAAF